MVEKDKGIIMTRRNTKRITSRDFSIHYVHDGTAEINCCTCSITKIFQSFKGGALFGGPLAGL